MDRLLYLAMTGAKHAMLAQQSVGHNLANANTPGFRSDFERLVSEPVSGPGLPTRVYAEEARPGSDLSKGSIMTTGNELDVAVNGEGWLAVQAADGSEAYTRRGDLKVNTSGMLENGAGDPVMGQNGPISIPPFQKLEIGVDGSVSIQPLGQDITSLVLVDRIKMVNPPTGGVMEKGQDGLFRSSSGRKLDPDASVRIVSGSLESSNVNTVEALTNMIEHSRDFETQIKMMETARTADQATTRLLRIT